MARVSTELEEIKRAENSPSLWKLHADSLLALLEVARALQDHAGEVMDNASQQGNHSEGETIKASLQRLRQRSDVSLTAVADTGSRAAGA